MMEMAGLLIPVLTFTAVLCLGGAVLVNRAARRRPVESRLSELGAVVEAPTSPKGQGLTLGLLSLLGRAASGRGPSAGLRGELAKAGFDFADGFTEILVHVVAATTILSGAAYVVKWGFKAARFGESPAAGE